MEQHLAMQLAELKAQVLKAEQVQQQLQIKQSIMSALCYTLGAVQHQLNPSECDIMDTGPESTFNQEELALLDHIDTQQPCVSSNSCNRPARMQHQRYSSASPVVQGRSRTRRSSAAGSCADDWPNDTLSPPDDPLRYFRQLLENGPLPCAQLLTVQDLQEQYRETIRDGLLHILFVEHPQAQQQQSAQVERSLAIIKQSVHVYLHRWTSLVACGRGDLLYQFHLSNCITGETVEQQDLQPYQIAAQHLGLTQQQKRRIADCMPVFKQLQQAVLDELQQVQQQPVHEPGHDACSQLPMGMTLQPSSRQLSHLKNSQRTQRLHMLLRKQHLIGVCCNAYVLGCMTHLQAAKLGQIIFPFPVFMFLFAAEVEKLVQQEQAQAGQTQVAASAAAAAAQSNTTA